MSKDTFFDEKPILISIPGFDTFTIFMRPLKVREIPLLNRITYLQEKDPSDQQAALMLVLLAVSTTNVSKNDLPGGAAGGLVRYFIEYNFPKDENIEPPSSKKKGGMAECFDFLISNGHIYSDIMDYPVKHFNKLVDVASIRLGLKKEPMDAVKAFGKLGIPVLPRNQQPQK